MRLSSASSPNRRAARSSPAPSLAGKIGRHVQLGQPLPRDLVPRAQPRRLLEAQRRLHQIADVIGQHRAQLDQPLGAPFRRPISRLQLHLVQARHARPVAERAIQPPAGLDGARVVRVGLEGALVALHRQVEPAQLALVQLAELHVDGALDLAARWAPPRRARPPPGIGAATRPLRRACERWRRLLSSCQASPAPVSASTFVTVKRALRAKRTTSSALRVLFEVLTATAPARSVSCLRLGARFLPAVSLSIRRGLSNHGGRGGWLRGAQTARRFRLLQQPAPVTQNVVERRPLRFR